MTALGWLTEIATGTGVFGHTGAGSILGVGAGGGLGKAEIGPGGT